jgi:ATP-dependent helicase/nuclease subunit B
MTAAHIKSNQKFSNSLVKKLDEKLQMASIVHSFLGDKCASSLQKATALAPSILELIARLDVEEIDINKIETSPWGSGVKHVDEIIDILPKVIKNWRRIAKQKGLGMRDKLHSKTRIITSQISAIRNLNDIECVECKSLREEALCTLIRTKEILKDSDKKTVSIVSDNPQLIKIISSLSKLWDIKINNCFGAPFQELEQIDFIRLIFETVKQNFAPAHLLALLRHKMFALNKKDFDFNCLIAKLERKYLLGVRRYETLEELVELVSENQLRVFLWLLQEELKSFIELMSKDSVSFQNILKELGGLAVRISHLSETSILHDLVRINVDTGNISPSSFLKIFDSLIANERLCLTPTKQARVKIFSLIDKKALDCDYVIITGLNEETFFKSRSYDVRIIQATYEILGLKKNDREFARVEQAFVNLLHRKNALLTRATIINGAPQTPSRLLVKLELMARKLRVQSLYNKDLSQEVRTLYEPSEFAQLSLPSPTPPVEKRLNRLSVTQVETLIRDPYGVYVDHILKLKRLEKVDKELGQLEFGKFIHGVIDRFSRNYAIGKSNQHYFKEVMCCGREQAANMIKFPAVKSIWLTQLKKVADWIISFEARKRNKKMSVKIYTERRGAIKLSISHDNNFILSCKADRIEITDGCATIIDFKTGGAPSKKEVFSGVSPQLPLEALILLEKGFDDMPVSKKTKLDICELSYITLGAGVKFGNVVSFTDGLKALIDETCVGVKELITFYSKATTPFLVCPDFERAGLYNDHYHIERLEELYSGYNN